LGEAADAEKITRVHALGHHAFAQACSPLCSPKIPAISGCFYLQFLDVVMGNSHFENLALRELEDLSMWRQVGKFNR